MILFQEDSHEPLIESTGRARTSTGEIRNLLISQGQQFETLFGERGPMRYYLWVNEKILVLGLVPFN